MEQVGLDLGNGYLGLGVVGATLFIMLVFVTMLMKYNNKIMLKTITGYISSGDKVDKLCDKIDALVTVIHTQQTASNKDQKAIIELLNRILTCDMDIQRRVVRIDDRTFGCRGNKEEKLDG